MTQLVKGGTGIYFLPEVLGPPPPPRLHAPAGGRTGMAVSMGHVAFGKFYFKELEVSGPRLQVPHDSSKLLQKRLHRGQALERGLG